MHMHDVARCRTEMSAGVATRLVATVSARQRAASRAQDKTRRHVAATKHSTPTPSPVNPVFYTDLSLSSIWLCFEGPRKVLALDISLISK